MTSIHDLAPRSRDVVSDVDVGMDAATPQSVGACDAYAQLCYVTLKAGLSAHRALLTAHFPPTQLVARLAEPDTHKRLRRLYVRRIIRERQWRRLYARDKTRVTLDRIDLPLATLLARHACGVTRPQPHGWLAPPVSRDISRGAALMRFQVLRRDLAACDTAALSTEYHTKYLKKLQACLTAINPVDNPIDGPATHTDEAGGSGSTKEHLTELLKRWDSQEPEGDDGERAAEWAQTFATWHAVEEEVWEKESAVEAAKARRGEDIPTLQRRIESQEMTQELLLARANAQSRAMSVKRHQAAEASAKVPKPASDDRWSHIPGGMQIEERRLLEKYYERLLSEVKPDTLVEQLMSQKLLDMEESNEVFSCLKSRDQMRSLIEFLVGKTHNSFQKFLDALRHKNVPLHRDISRDYVAVMDEILRNRPQGLPYCQNLLHERYKKESSWRPYPWYKHIKTNLDTYFCPLQIIDIKGNTAQTSKLFAPVPYAMQQDPRWVVIEGDAGTGKSTLAKYLSYKWIEQPNVFGWNVKLLIYLDLKILAPNIKTMVTEQLFGTNLQLTENQIWEVIEEYQDDTLFLLDGYEDNTNDDIQSLLFGNIVPTAKVLLFTQSNFTSRLQNQYDVKYILTGFADRQNEEFVKNYVQLTNRPSDLFTGYLTRMAQRRNARNGQVRECTKQELRDILTSPNLPPPNRTRAMSINMAARPAATSFIKLEGIAEAAAANLKDDNSDDSASPVLKAINVGKLATLRHYSQIPLYCGFFCVMCDMRLPYEMTTWTAILEHYIGTIKMKLIERDHEKRLDVNKTFTELTRIALSGIKQGISTMHLKEDDCDVIIKFGFLKRAVNLTSATSNRFYFPNRIIQEYLAAKCLDSNAEESARFLQNVSMTRQVHNLNVLYCGLRKSDNENRALQGVISKMVEINNRQQAALKYLANSGELQDDGDDNAGSSQPCSSVMDYQLSMECVAQMEGRQDVTQSIAETMPKRMKVRHDGIIPIYTLAGFSAVIRLNSTCVTEVDIVLDGLAQHALPAFTALAEAIQASDCVETLRIYWENREVMANFLTRICRDNHSLRTIECYDQSHSTQHENSLRVNADIRVACQAMDKVKAFAFRDCHSFGLVSSILRNIPITLEHLDLSGCDMNMIAAQDLAQKLNTSRTIAALLAANVRIDSMSFNTFIHSLSVNRSIVHLDLSGVKLDNVGFFALNEALRMNNKLESLDLRRIAINARACDDLMQVLKINTKLKRVCVTPERIGLQGRQLLLRGDKNKRVTGIRSDTRHEAVEEDIQSLDKYQE